MKTKDAYNGSRRMGERFLRLWSELAQGVFPFIMEEVWELDYGHRLFVSVCEAVIDPKEFEYAKWCGNGRPKADRVSMFKAYILKMTLNLKGDKELVALLRQQPLSRRLCGWRGTRNAPPRGRRGSRGLWSRASAPRLRPRTSGSRRAAQEGRRGRTTRYAGWSR